MPNILFNSLTTKILNPQSYEDLDEAVSILRNSGVVALPTETVYGLAANAMDLIAVQKIFKAKQRPANNPLIWHVHNKESAQKLFAWSTLSPRAQERFNKLAQAFWPGPLTLVASRSQLVASDNLTTIAVRIPRSEVTLKILENLNSPLVMPSANISSRPSPTCSAHVLKTLAGRIDAIVDGGSCEVGIESTVISFDQEQVFILRPGQLSQSDIENIIQEKILHKTSDNISNPQSPGILYKHYVPKVREILLKNSLHTKHDWLHTTTFIGRSEDIYSCEKAWGIRAVNSLTLRLPDEPSYFAHGLYEALYKAEERPEQRLIILTPPLTPPWAAIHDRLRRSAG